MAFVRKLFTAASMVTVGANKYALVDQSKSFSEAQAYCETTYQSDLASIHDEADQTAVADLCLDSSDWYCWIGLNDIANEGRFVWQDGTTFDYGSDTSGGVAPWYGTNPNDKGGNEDCVIVNSIFGYKWSDQDCVQDHPFICNVNNPTSAPTQMPSNAPSDSTSNPTTNPTRVPSSDPTSSPTQLPSTVPSISASPSQYPSANPSDAPSIPPSVPPTTTVAPVDNEYDENENGNENEVDDEDEDEDAESTRHNLQSASQAMNYPLLFGCIGTVAVCAACLCFGIWLAYRRNNAMAADQNQQNMKKEDVIPAAAQHEAKSNAKSKPPVVQRVQLQSTTSEGQGRRKHPKTSVATGEGAELKLNVAVNKPIQNIQRFCDAAQNDEEVVGDDEQTTGGAKDVQLQPAPLNDVHRFCDDAANDEEVVGDDDGHITQGTSR